MTAHRSPYAAWARSLTAPLLTVFIIAAAPLAPVLALGLIAGALQ
jgi:hypothetical protein